MENPFEVPKSAVERKDLEKHQKTMTSHSRFGMSEHEMGEIIRVSYQEIVESRGIRFKPFDELMTNAIDVIAKFLVMRTGFSGILIYGKPGTGKTSLIQAVKYVMGKISDSIQKDMDFNVGFVNPSQNISTKALASCKIGKVNLLLLDDVGLEHMNERSNSKTLDLKDLIACRYDYCLPTIMASVFDQISLGEIYGQRLLDCVQERYMIIELSHNYRQENIRAREPMV